MIRFSAARHDEIAERTGYRFKNKALLRHALTHASTRKKREDYERLEFLGDRVLGLVIAEELYRHNPDAKEGQMSARHSGLVRGETCAIAGRSIGLEQFIIVGDSEHNMKLHLNETVIGDVMEALIGAVYLDGGFDEARDFILRLWKPLFEANRKIVKDAKTYLQEWALARSLPIPDYRLLSREGPEHAPMFLVAVDVKGKQPVEGKGKSKRLAEQDAASHFLKRERIRR